MPEPIEFVRRGGSGSTELYACGKCGQIYSPRIYVGADIDGITHARMAAENCSACREHNQDTDNNEAAATRAKRARIAKAKIVNDLEFCFSDDGDNAYGDVHSARDAGETGVFGATFVPYRIDAGSVIEGVLTDHHDDSSEDELRGIDDLYAAIEAFNNRQTQGSYHMDDSRWQEIRQTETFAMIKPDATARGVEDAMIADIEAGGFTIIEKRRRRLDRSEAEHLYAEHRQREHFRDLVDYTISGDVVMLHLSGDDGNVPARFRELMGATDREKAEPHTLRARYAVGYRENSIHGSDSPAAAIEELWHFMGQGSKDEDEC